MGTTDSFETAWAALVPAARRCLELAHRSWLDGGLPVGAVLTGADGTVVAEGRNRAYDPPGGAEPLQGTPLAHAELNALAVARTGWDLAAHTLWSSHEPCGMCAAAAAFTGVGAVRHLAPDPWAVASGHSDAPVPAPGRSGSSGLSRPSGPRWAGVAANLLFLADAVRAGGPGHRTVRTALAADPLTTRLALDVVADVAAGRPASAADLPALLAPLWPRIVEAATA
ncbi:nucleoside deaminase [Kitasatospora sp. NPDC056181]|uniref:nucleoside deaminase n=1 Tax=Kitasatospora sp. NPDC056181 TaxID=3345737 RepID=UPI0035D70E26